MQPILVVTDSTSPNRLSSYIVEILDIEGLCYREVLDLSHARLDSDLLAGRDLVVLANIALDKATQGLLQDYVSGGGNLIALRPPAEMAGVFGLEPAQAEGRVTAEGYATFDLRHPAAAHLPAPSLQIHGETDLHEPGDVEVIARLSAEPGAETHFPAIVANRHERGQAAAFTFDLAACVVMLHQGTPANASTGPNPDPDRDQTYRANDLFYGYLDRSLKHIPQADLYQDVLVSLILRMAARGAPLPRLWHFPHAAPALALIDGDSDSLTAPALDHLLRIIESAGGKYTLYVMADDFAALSAQGMDELRQRGHDFGPHLWCGRRPSPEQARDNMARQSAAFRAAYGYSPLATRGHSIVWSGWAEQAESLRDNGLRLDNSFMPALGFQSGYLNGSGLPVKFMSPDGRLVDVYEQATLGGDDTWMDPGEKCLLPAMTVEQAIALSRRQIDDAVDRHHSVYHPYFHPYYMTAGDFRTGPWLEAVVQHVRERGIPFVNAREWVEFNDARRAVSIDKLDWDSRTGDLSFEVACPMPISGLTVLLPGEFAGKQVDPESVALPVRAASVTLEGRSQLAVTLDLEAGVRRNLRLRYRSA